MDSQKLTYILIPVFVICISLVFLNALFNNFVWDDFGHVVDNIMIRNMRNIPLALGQNIIVRGYKVSNYYRPLQPISYMADYKLWGLNPFGYHLTNLILHILNGLLLYLVVFSLLKNNILSFLCSIIYCLHPTHTSVVSYISGRADILASIFFLSSFYLYIKSETVLKNRILIYLSSVAAFSMCLLSKESVLMFPFILLSYELMFNGKRRLIRTVPFFLFVIVYVLLRANITDYKIELFLKDPDIPSRLIASLKMFLEYICILLLPLRLRMERSLGAHNYLGYEAALFLIMAVSLIITLRKSRYFKLILFGFIWFLINIIPVLNIIPLHARLAENWLYLPSIGFVLAMTLVMREFFDEDKIFLCVAVSIFLILGALTIKQNAKWKDSIALYKYGLSVEPRSYKFHNNLGSAYYKQGNVKEAIDEYKKAIELNPNNFDSYFNLAVINIDLGQFDEAEAQLKAAESIDWENPYLYFTKARLYLARGNKKEAGENLKMALSIYPDYYDAYKYLKELVENEPELKDARELVKKEPDSAQSHYKLGSAYLKDSLFYDAIEELSRAVFLKNEFAEAHNNLGCAYASIKEFKEAIREFNIALQFDKDYADAYSNIGVYYANLNRFKKARFYLNKALSIEPGHEKSLKMLKVIGDIESKKRLKN